MLSASIFFYFNVKNNNNMRSSRIHTFLAPTWHRWEQCDMKTHTRFACRCMSFQFSGKLHQNISFIFGDSMFYIRLPPQAADWIIRGNIKKGGIIGAFAVPGFEVLFLRLTNAEIFSKAVHCRETFLLRHQSTMRNPEQTSSHYYTLLLRINLHNTLPAQQRCSKTPEKLNTSKPSRDA